MCPKYFSTGLRFLSCVKKNSTSRYESKSFPIVNKAVMKANFEWFADLLLPKETK
jgi:hypothetical protein